MTQIHFPVQSDSKNVKKVLQDIDGALIKCINVNEQEGLLSGNCGAALFYAYYYRLTGKKKHLQALHNIISKTIESIGENEMGWSHCSGISGIAWCIQHLMEHGFIEQEGMEDIFADLDEHLSEFMKDELSNGRYDFLHEGLGVILYFIQRLPDPNAQRYLEEAVVALQNWAVDDEYGIRWKDNFTQKSQLRNNAPVYNLGLAHGVPAVVSVLTLLYEKGILPTKTLSLIDGALQWILSTRHEESKGCLSLFPTIVSAQNIAIGDKQSRLGWCYGDLGIAVTLWNAGKSLQNERYKLEALEIFDHTLAFRDKDNGSISDACLCHGTMCVSHIFRRLYRDTGEKIYQETAHHWLQESIGMASWKDGLAGFKHLLQDGYQNNHNLIEGIAGIGLGIIAALDETTNPAWDRCLLLS